MAISPPVVSPNPVVRPASGGVTANIYIGGLTPGTRYNIRVDATTIATARATREGSLAVGITVGSASKLGGHAVDVRDSANKATLAAGTFTVAAAAPPPPVDPPPVDPPPVVTPPPAGAYPTPRKLAPFPVNNDPKPAVGQVITDSITGTRIRRLTGDGHQNQYAKHQAWSKDGSLILLQFGYVVDAKTFATLGNIATGSEYPLWSNVEPATLYSIAGTGSPDQGDKASDSLIRRWTKATGWQTYADLRQLGYIQASAGDYEGTLSRDDRIALLARKADGSTWILVYDLPGKRIVGAAQRPWPNGASITQSGRYVVAGYNSKGTDSAHGTWLFRDDMTVVRQMVGGQQWGGNVGAPLGHQDSGWALDGAEVLVYVEPGGSYTMAQELATGREYIVAGGIFGVGHVSCAAYDRPGYAYLSSNSFYPGAYGVNQAIAVPIAPNPDPPMGEAFACLHAVNPATSQDYDHTPHVSASRDGRLVIWGSVWSNTSSGPMSAYIAGVTA